MTAYSWWQLQNAVFFAGLIHHAQLKCWRTEVLTNSLSFDNSCSETCWLPASACCRLIWLVMIADVDLHPFRVALYHLQWLPVLYAKGGEEICHLLLFPLSALRCCIIRRHTVGSVRVRNSSLFVQQRLKHVPVDPHRPCGTSRDDVHATCCLFACCCFIVSYN